jgi:hypothetical protein
MIIFAGKFVDYDVDRFLSEFPDEASCKSKFKEFREQAGVVCHKCGGTEHYWKRDRE